MATQEILVKYKADVSDLTNQLKTVIERMDKLEAESKSSAKGVDVLTKSADKLEKEIKDVNKEFTKATPAVKDFSKTATQETNKLSSSVATFGAGIAASISAAFSVAAVLNFGKASINAFLEAQKSAERLKFAVVGIAGESEVAFTKLFNQSQKLRDEFKLFSDEDIQAAQSQLATFGLFSDQIEQLTPRILEFANAQKTDARSATETFIRALEGQTRGLVTAGLKFKDTGTILGNYNELLEASAKLTGSTAAATETLAGHLQAEEVAAEELQETIGQQLAPAYVALKVALFEAVLGLLGFNKAAKETEQLKFDAVASNFEKAAKKIRDSGGDVQEDFQKRVDEIQKINDEAAKKIEETKKRLDKALNERDAGTPITFISEPLEKEIKLNEEIIKVNNAKIQKLKEVIDLEKLNAKRIEETLTAEELRLFNLEKLNDLLLENESRADQVSKDNVTRINAEITIKKKQADELKKINDQSAADRIAANDKAFEDFKTQLEKEQDELLKVIERAEQRAKDQDALLEFRVRFVTNLEGEEAAFQFARDELFKTFQEESIQADVTSDTVTEANAKKQKAYEEYISALTKLVGDFAIFEQKEVEQTQETVVADWINANEEILSSTEQLVTDIAALFAALTERQLIELHKQTEAQLEALDIQQRGIDDQLDKRRISETEAERKTEQLTQERIAVQKKADAEERRIKKKQFDIDKAAAIVRIIINTAQAVTAALTIPPPAGEILAALNAAAGAIELATVAAQTNPYKKGTKSAKKGLALVDEEGTEAILRGKGRLTTLERGDKVLTAPKTKTYGEVLDAMMDNRFEKYVMQKYVAPQLEKQRKISQAKDKQDFAENITKSMVINNMSDGESGFHLKKIRQGGLSVRLPKDQLDYIAQQSKSDPYR